MEIWQQELKERELAVAAYEAAVFQHELEYRPLEHFLMCGKRGRNGDVQGQQARANDEMRQREERRWGEVIARRTSAKVVTVNAT